MKKRCFTFCLLGLLVLTSSGLGADRDYQFQLSAGSSYLEAEFDAHFPMEKGYWRAGAGGLYRDRGSKEYYMIQGTLGVGSSSFVKGLDGNLGIRPLVGNVKNTPHSDAVGAVGFNLDATYHLPEKIAPIPIVLLGGFTGAPDILSFAKLEKYQEFRMGVRVYVVENAAVSVSYRHHNFDMQDNWGMSDDVFSVGMSLSF